MSQSTPKPGPRPVESLSAEDFYKIKLDVFEGPLDLLLHLIRKHEIDIFDIPIAKITEEYLSYVKIMQGLNLDLAGEFLVMAATLMHIKSRMLLPKPPIEEDEDQEDPREELVRRLLEYQKYKDAAERLSSQDLLFRDLFPRGMMEAMNIDDGGEAPLKEIGLFELVAAFQRALGNIKEEDIHEVTMERISIGERIGQLVDILNEKNTLTFTDLFGGKPKRKDLILSFLAVLEMVRLHLIRTFQAKVGGEIYLTKLERPTGPDAEALPEALEAPEEPPEEPEIK